MASAPHRDPYSINLACGTYDVTAEISHTAGIDLDLFVLAPSGCETGQCLDIYSYGNADIALYDLAPGAYYLAVDGFFGAVGSYTLSLTCTRTGGPDCNVYLPLVVRKH
jgi:hypothetical protein